MTSPIQRRRSPARSTTKARDIRWRRVILSGRIQPNNPIISVVPPTFHSRMILPSDMVIRVTCDPFSACKMQYDADKKHNPLKGEEDMKSSSGDVLQEV